MRRFWAFGRQPGSYPPGCSRQPRGMDAESGASIAPSRAGQRRTVSGPRVFRSARPRSSQVRNAAPGRSRGTAGEPIGSRIRVLTTFLLPGAGDFPAGRPAGADAPEAGAQASSQAHRRGARIPPPGPSGRSLFTLGGSGFAHPGPLWHHGSSTQHRTRFGAQPKKTAVNEALPQSAAGEDWAVRYEQLRNDVLSQANGGGFGLILLLRQGMTAWMRACSCVLTPVPAPTGSGPIGAELVFERREKRAQPGGQAVVAVDGSRAVEEMRRANIEARRCEHRDVFGDVWEVPAQPGARILAASLQRLGHPGTHAGDAPVPAELGHEAA